MSFFGGGVEAEQCMLTLTALPPECLRCSGMNFMQGCGKDSEVSGFHRVLAFSEFVVDH